MKKPFLLFSLKCAVIVYFAACSGIDSLTAAKSITPQVTKGSWKVNCYSNTQTDNTCIFEGYSFAFEPSGKVTAEKNNISIEGYWLEDNINKNITEHPDCRMFCHRYQKPTLVHILQNTKGFQGN